VADVRRSPHRASISKDQVLYLNEIEMRDDIRRWPTA
jgi:hypothetical protein